MSETLLSTKHLGVICAVAGNSPLEEQEWKKWLELLKGADTDEVCVVFRCGDGAPNARQRRDLFALTEHRSFRFAVMTESQAAKMMMTAFEWMGDIEIQGFGYDDFDGALEYLDVSSNFHPGLERKVRALTEQLGKNAPSEESGVRAKGAAARRDHAHLRVVDGKA